MQQQAKALACTSSDLVLCIVFFKKFNNIILYYICIIYYIYYIIFGTSGFLRFGIDARRTKCRKQTI